MHLSAYLKILRPLNAAMSSGAVCIGAWISANRFSVKDTIVLAAVAAIATGFGNVINDIIDIETDRISHPDRPLVRGAISRTGALIYAALLAVIALVAAFKISILSGVATLFPLLNLTVYALALKGTPLVGNLTVSFLVAYAILYGGLSAPHFSHLIVPSILAALLNFSREIIKDIQDAQGDFQAGLATSAVLPDNVLKRLLFFCSGLYLALVFLPLQLGHFGCVYALTVLITALPLHIYRLFLIGQADWKKETGAISILYKIEMVCGLVAIAADRMFTK